MPTQQPDYTAPRALKADEKRIRLAGCGPSIDKTTLGALNDWQSRGPSYGVLIDRLTSHALSTGFDPVTEKTIKPSQK